VPFGDVFDAAVGWSWMVTIEGVPFNEITSIDGIKMVMDTIEYKFNDKLGHYNRKKLPGRLKSGTITIVRGLTQYPDGKLFTDWITEVYEGNMKSARKNVVISVMDYMAGQAMQFCAKNAWPSTISVGNFKAGDASVMQETVTLDHEGIYVGEHPGDW
jgi:phage tail-like protein